MTVRSLPGQLVSNEIITKLEKVSLGVKPRQTMHVTMKLITFEGFKRNTKPLQFHRFSVHFNDVTSLQIPTFTNICITLFEKRNSFGEQSVCLVKIFDHYYFL